MDIIKVGILGVAAVLMAIPLRKEKQEYSMFLSMAVCICIFIYIITKVQIVLEFVEKLEGMIAIDSTYIGLVIKMVGITYAAEFAVNVCRDSGYGAIATGELLLSLACSSSAWYSCCMESSLS